MKKPRFLREIGLAIGIGAAGTGIPHEAEANPFAGIEATAETHETSQQQETMQQQQNRELPPLTIHPTIEAFEQLSIVITDDDVFFENSEGRKVMVYDQLDTALQLDENGAYMIEIDGTTYTENIQFIILDNGTFILTAGEYVVDTNSDTPERITQSELDERRNQDIDFTASL